MPGSRAKTRAGEVGNRLSSHYRHNGIDEEPEENDRGAVAKRKKGRKESKKIPDKK